MDDNTKPRRKVQTAGKPMQPPGVENLGAS